MDHCKQQVDCTASGRPWQQALVNKGNNEGDRVHE